MIAAEQVRQQMGHETSKHAEIYAKYKDNIHKYVDNMLAKLVESKEHYFNVDKGIFLEISEEFKQFEGKELLASLKSDFKAAGYWCEMRSLKDGTPTLLVGCEESY